MKWPRGETVHQNLSTEYTNVPDLLLTLTSNGFDGVVEVVLSRETGTFFVSEGQVRGAAVESGPGQATKFGREVTEELLGLINTQVGTLNIYKLSPSQVDAIISKFCSEIVFKGLTTDFVKLDKFIQKLGVEHHTGYIEVFTKKNIIMGTLFLREGEMVDLHLPSEPEVPALSEPQAIPAFLEDVIRQGAIFDVYKSCIENIPSAEPVAQKRLEPASEVDEEEMLPLEEPTKPGSETVDARDEIEEQAEEIPGEFSLDGRDHVLGALKEIIARTERFVDGFSQEGIFLRAFKRSLIEKSDLYPFLDPFMDQFDYRKGEISLDEDVELEQFATGIADCFNLTLAHLKKEFPRTMNMSLNVKAELESTFKLYQDAMQQSGVQSVAPMLFK